MRGDRTEPVIMVADDAMFMRRVIRKALAKGGYTDIVEVDDGSRILEEYSRCKPDLVLLDITMPGISGLEVLEKLLLEDSEASVVMCSAIGQETTIAEAVRRGARDFIIKPFRDEEMLQIVRRYL